MAEEQNPEGEVEAKHMAAETDTATKTMSEIETPEDQENPSLEASKKPPPSFSFSIWPPTQKTRDAVIKRLIETLSTPSILSKRYGSIPRDDAAEIAKRIEEAAFSAAGESDHGDGIMLLQVYSKEASKRMLEVVKSRSAPTPAPENVPSRESEMLDVPPANGEEIQAVKAEP